VESRKGLAEMYFNYNNLEDALDEVQEVVLTASHENDWAKEFIGRILTQSVQHVPSYFALGRIYMAEGNQQRAIDVYKELLQVAPSEVTNVISELEGVKEKRGALLLFLGRMYAAVGDTAQSLLLFDTLFAKDASFADAIVRELRHILQKNAKISEAHMLLYRVFMHERKYEDALEEIEYTQQLMPENEEVILKKGLVLYALGEADRAIKLYTELLHTTEDKAAIYRLIRETRARYFTEKLELTQGETDEVRLDRAHLYLIMDQPDMAEQELQFAPRNSSERKRHTLLKARVYLVKNRPIDALEIMKDMPADQETAPTYADIYDALGSYEAAALVLRQTGVKGMEQRIATYEKRVQERRLAKGRYFVEGRS
jgi:tetratricopeptide (TPR) repeat protein